MIKSRITSKGGGLGWYLVDTSILLELLANPADSISGGGHTWETIMCVCFDLAGSFTHLGEQEHTPIWVANN